MELFGLLGLLMLLNCGYANRHYSNSSCEQALVDSLEVRIQGSLFSNVHYPRSQLLEALTQAQGFLTYYRLLAFYGETFFVSSDFDSILYYNRRVKEFSRNTSRFFGSLQSPQWNDILSDVYNIEGNAWMQLNRPDSAIIDYKRVYGHRLKEKERYLLPDICINIADAYLRRSDLAYAASCYRHALFLCDSLDLSEYTKFSVYYGLGQTYMESCDFDLSNYYYGLAGQFFDKMNVSKQWTYLNNRNNHYYYQKNYQEASRYIRRTNVLVSSYPRIVFEQNFIKVNLGELYLLVDKLDSAQVCLDESYRFFSDIQHNLTVHYTETQVIGLALRRGNIAQAKIMVARTAPMGHPDANMLTIRNQYLQHYFEYTGDYRRACEYLKRDCHLNDSIQSEQVQMRVAELDMCYRQDTIAFRKEMKIQRQAAEMKVLELSVPIWVLVYVLLVAEAVVVIWYMRKKREFLRQRSFQQINRVRMENLRSRASPHFTFNVLGHEINQFDGSEEVKHNLMKLVKYLRHSLELTGKLSVFLQDKLDLVRTYIELERGRVGGDLVATITVEDGLDAARTMIPSMIVQIPVENAVRHGLTRENGEKELMVYVSRETNGIRITATDSGRGYLPQVVSTTRGTGIGLKMLYQTIRLLSTKNKSGKIYFNVTNRSDGQTGMEVSVYIPFCFSYDL